MIYVLVSSGPNFKIEMDFLFLSLYCKLKTWSLYYNDRKRKCVSLDFKMKFIGSFQLRTAHLGVITDLRSFIDQMTLSSCLF